MIALGKSWTSPVSKYSCFNNFIIFGVKISSFAKVLKENFSLLTTTKVVRRNCVLACHRSYT